MTENQKCYRFLSSSKGLRKNLSVQVSGNHVIGQKGQRDDQAGYDVVTITSAKR